MTEWTRGPQEKPLQRRRHRGHYFPLVFSLSLLKSRLSNKHRSFGAGPSLTSSQPAYRPTGSSGDIPPSRNKVGRILGIGDVEPLKRMGSNGERGEEEEPQWKLWLDTLPRFGIVSCQTRALSEIHWQNPALKQSLAISRGFTRDLILHPSKWCTSCSLGPNTISQQGTSRKCSLNQQKHNSPVHNRFHKKLVARQRYSKNFRLSSYRIPLTRGFILLSILIVKFYPWLPE